MTTILLIIHLFVTLALIGVVLIQRSEGGGLGIGTSQGMGSFMSGRGTANLLTRTTAILATIFMLLSLTLALLNRGTAGVGRSILDVPPPAAAPAPAPAPGPAPAAPSVPPPAGSAAPAPAPAPAPPSARGRGPGRNAVGIAAAVLLVAVYLLVAAVAHLTPFPAAAVTAASSSGHSPAPAPDASPDAAPDGSPDAAPDPAPDQDASPSSPYGTLLALIPGTVQNQDTCVSTGPGSGAIAEAECDNLQGLPAVTLYYYLYANQGALSNGFSSFLTSENFTKGSTACTADSEFTEFVSQCEDTFTNQSPVMAGSIAEYVNKSNYPIIVSSDNQQLVMAVMIGSNDDDLLGYWKQLQWIQT